MAPLIETGEVQPTAPELTVLGVYCRPKEEDSGDEESDDSSEEEQQQSPPPAKEEEQDPKLIKAKKTMIRRRMKLRRIVHNDDNNNDDHVTDDDDDYETAMFVPKDGLTQSMFYHNDLEEHSSDDDDSSDDEEEGQYPVYELNLEDRVYEERTILLQSYEHYQQLATHPHTSSYFDSMKKKSNDKLEEDFVLNNPRFGEQIIIKGMDSKQICIGDIFAAVATTTSANNNNTSTSSSSSSSSSSYGLMIEVTSPRLACAEIDKKNCSPFGRDGIRRYTNTNGMAGWFVRVLQTGSVLEGTTLRRIAHPNPKWTLREVAKALYGECYDTKYYNLGWAQWNRSKPELEELCGLSQLGWMEWKDEAQWILDRWDKIQKEKKQYLLMAKKAKEAEAKEAEDATKEDNNNREEENDSVIKMTTPTAATTSTNVEQQQPNHECVSIPTQIRHDIVDFDEQVKNFVVTNFLTNLTKKPNLILISIGLILSISYQWQALILQGLSIASSPNADGVDGGVGDAFADDNNINATLSSII